MGVLYPGPVSRHNLVSPLLSFWYRVPVWIMATMVVVVSLVDMGPPRTRPVGSESEWPGECHGSRSVLTERRWSTRMGAQVHGFYDVNTMCQPLQSVYKLSIAASSVMGMGSY